MDLRSAPRDGRTLTLTVTAFPAVTEAGADTFTEAGTFLVAASASGASSATANAIAAATQTP